jgi:hypothetical protein
MLAKEQGRFVASFSMGAFAHQQAVLIPPPIPDPQGPPGTGAAEEGSGAVSPAGVMLV